MTDGPPGSGDAIDELADDLADSLAEEEAEAEAVDVDLEAMELAVDVDAAGHLADLQRLKAEFDNYRRRVERDRDLVRELAVGGVIADLLPVLDDIDRADSHDELIGGFRSVAENLRGVLAKSGLESFGDAGDEFDPAVHEALTHRYSDDVDTATCVEVYQRGYRFAGRVLRPARVAVAEPDAG